MYVVVFDAMALVSEGIEQDPDSLGLAQTQTKIRFSRQILAGREIDKRTRIATFGQDLSGWDYEAKRLDVLTNVAQPYIDVLAAQSHVEVAHRTVDLAGQVPQAVAQQVVPENVLSLNAAGLLPSFSKVASSFRMQSVSYVQLGLDWPRGLV
jgi:hypothetical protein